MQHQLRLAVVALAGTIQVELGSAPAPGAADDALVVGIRVCVSEPFGAGAARSVRREGAPNRSRGGCAPHTFQLNRSGLTLALAFTAVAAEKEKE